MWFCSNSFVLNHLTDFYIGLVLNVNPHQALTLFLYWCVLKRNFFSKILRTNYFHHQLWWNNYVNNLFAGLTGTILKENWTSGFLEIMNSRGSRKNRELWKNSHLGSKLCVSYAWIMYWSYVDCFHAFLCLTFL